MNDEKQKVKELRKKLDITFSDLCKIYENILNSNFYDLDINKYDYGVRINNLSENEFKFIKKLLNILSYVEYEDFIIDYDNTSKFVEIKFLTKSLRLLAISEIIHCL